MSERPLSLEEFEDLTEEDYQAIRDHLGQHPGSWVCVMCENVFGPDVRAFRASDGTAPELFRLIEEEQALCDKCFLHLTTPPPNNPFGSDPEPS